MENFKVGDVVQLKSGSPAMTIVELYNNNEFATCTWYDFSISKWTVNESFSVHILKKVEDENDINYNEL